MMHTKGDWEIETHFNSENEKYLVLYGRIGMCHKPIARLLPDCKYADEEDAANAQFIVRACNCHEELLESLQTILNIYGANIWSNHRCKAHEAIKKARGEG